MPQQGIDPWLTPAKGNEEFHGIPRATLLEDVLAEGTARIDVEDALFLEKREGIGGQDFGPLVAVVARRVPTGEDVGKAVGKAVEGRRLEGRDLIPYLLQDLVDPTTTERIVFQVDAEVEEGEFELACHLRGGLEVLGGPQALEEILGDRRAGFHMAGDQVQRLPFPTPVFQKLTWQFHGIPGYAGDSAHGRVVDPGQQVVQAMTAFVKDGQYLGMGEQ